MSEDLSGLLEKYQRASQAEASAKREKAEARDAILQAMRLSGLEVAEAGGMRGSISVRTDWGFNSGVGIGTNDDGNSTEAPLPDHLRLERLSRLHQFISTVSEGLDVPSSENISRAWKEFCSQRSLDPLTTEPPDFIARHDTPVLRVSGKPAKPQ